MLVLDRLWVQRSFKGELSAEVRFKGESSEIELKLDDEVSQRILEIVADAIMDASKEITNAMTAEVLEQTTKSNKELEDKS